MSEFSREQKIKEFRHKLEEQRTGAGDRWLPVLKKLLTTGLKHFPELAIRLEDGAKQHAVPRDRRSGEHQCLIRVGMAQSEEAIVYGLAHEFGHLLDDSPRPENPTVEQQLQREERAWKLGRDLLPESEFEEYFREQDRCLEGYRSLSRDFPEESFEQALQSGDENSKAEPSNNPLHLTYPAREPSGRPKAETGAGPAGERNGVRRTSSD